MAEASRYNAGMRLFYSSYISAESMRAYDVWFDLLVEELPEVVRSVPRKSQHLTLAFLGEVADRDVDGCLAALDPLAGFDVFEYSLGPPRLLLRRGGPRLIRVDATEVASGISELQASLSSTIGKCVPSVGTGLKLPHITLARCKRNLDRSEAPRIAAALDRLRDQPLPASDVLASVQLVKSSLTPTGPIYETVHEVRLADVR